MADSKANEEAHWDKTTKLMLTHLGIWFFFGYIIHMFVKPLNSIIIPILGFPLGFYMAAQGSLIVFVVMLFMFGPHHPRVFDEHVPLDRPRLILAVVAMVMFAVCFTPAPIEEFLRP